MYVTDRQTLEALIDRAHGSAYVAVDTEFMRERTYFPRLCLIQIATPDVAAIVDPLAFDDLGPLWGYLADESVLKVLHAGVQDLEIFFLRMGRVPSPVFDTQIAATLAGHPQQVGYGALVKHVTGETIDKSDTFTDWSKRPLSGTQIEYALNDVRYLPEIYEHLSEQLRAAGRLEWVESDFRRLADSESYRIDPDLIWRKLKRVSTLDRRQLAVLREVVAWRESEAQRRDVPRKWVIGDESLVEIARRAPKTRDELTSVRGVADKLSAKVYSPLLAAVQRGKEAKEEDLPRLERRPRREIAEGAVDLMAALVRHRAKQHKVAVPLLASRDELERLAAGEREGSPLLEGWRADIVGRELLDVLEGRLALKVSEEGLVPVSLDSDEE